MSFLDWYPKILAERATEKGSGYTVYEYANSPLNRPISIQANQSSKKVMIEYSIASSSEAHSYTSLGNKLFKKTVTDENGNSTSTYTDIFGTHSLCKMSAIANVIKQSTEYIEKLVYPKYNLFLFTVISVFCVVIFAKIVTKLIEWMKRFYVWFKCVMRLCLVYRFKFECSDKCISCKNKYKKTRRVFERVYDVLFNKNGKNNDKQNKPNKFTLDVVVLTISAMIISLFIVSIPTLKFVDVVCGFSNTNTASVLYDIYIDSITNEKFHIDPKTIELRDKICAPKDKRIKVNNACKNQKKIPRKSSGGVWLCYYFQGRCEYRIVKESCSSSLYTRRCCKRGNYKDPSTFFQSR